MTEERIIKSKKKSKIKIGDKFNRWTVLKNVGIIKACTHFRCRCKCGNIRIVSVSHLSSGHTKSCGCLKRERLVTHGMTGTPTYYSWVGMIQRCYNSNNIRYENYGGRGITVCQEWRKSFEVFFKDLGKRPQGLTIERIDNNLGYFKENCKWATYTEQNLNRKIQKNNKTGIKGVSWDARCQKYRVTLKINYKQYDIGHFKNLEDAKVARIAAEQKYWE